MQSTPIIHLNKLSFCYANNNKGLKDLSLSLPKGKKIALLGSNGAGKSTLILTLNGLIKPQKGTYLYDNKAVKYSRKALNQLRQKVGIVFQEPDNQIFAPSVYEEVAFGPHNLGLSKSDIEARVTQTLQTTNLLALKNHPPSQLSYGQKKRVTIASILSMQPEVLILDEPTSSLDARNAKEMIELLDTLNNQGTTIILSTHDVNMAYQWADMVVVLNEGQLLKTGTTKEIFLNTDLIQQAGLETPFLIEAYHHLKLKTPHLPLPKSLEDLFGANN